MTAGLTSPRSRLVAWVVIALCIGAVVVLQLVTTVRTSNVTDAIRQTQKTNTSVNTTNLTLLKIIHSCLTPGESCYRLGQSQRAEAAAGNQRASVAAASCAASLPRPTYHAVYRCVLVTLAQQGKKG